MGTQSSKSRSSKPKSTPIIKDSGARTEFSTGAVRDIQEGKGRCDLLPLDILSDITDDVVLGMVGEFKDSKGEAVKPLYEAIKLFCSRAYITETWMSLCDDPNVKVDSHTYNLTCYFEGMLEVAKHFEDGAKKYGEYNWQKGIPISRYIDSAVRHYLKHRSGWDDEPHDRAFVWNLLCCLWTIKHLPEMNDL